MVESKPSQLPAHMSQQAAAKLECKDYGSTTQEQCVLGHISLFICTSVSSSIKLGIIKSLKIIMKIKYMVKYLE